MTADNEPTIEPAVRAKFLQHWLTLPERHDPGSAIRLARLIGNDKRQLIFNAPALSWLPIALDLEVVNAVAEVLGARRYSEYARAYFLDIMPRPPLSALVELGTKLVGLTPEGFVRWWDKGWSVVYRGLGTVVGTMDGEFRAQVVHERMPAACLRSDAFVEALLSTAYGVYALTGFEGEASITKRDVERGQVTLQMHWSPKRAGRRPLS